MSARIITTLVFLLTALLIGVPVHSQTLDQVATNLELTDSNMAQAGMVVSTNGSTYEISKKEYDSQMYGVIVDTPALELNRPTSTTRSVVNQGQVLVLVTTKNGSIKAGDILTTSKSIGIAQKATHSGHVLGKALADFSSKEVGLTPVLLNINYSQVSAASDSLTSAGIDQVAKKITQAFAVGNLPSIFKYLFAIFLGVTSFFLGLSHFVKINRSAVEAIARNPMAKGHINQQILIGNIVVVTVCGLGLALALGILFFL